MIYVMFGGGEEDKGMLWIFGVVFSSPFIIIYKLGNADNRKLSLVLAFNRYIEAIIYTTPTLHLFSKP